MCMCHEETAWVETDAEIDAALTQPLAAPE